MMTVRLFSMVALVGSLLPAFTAGGPQFGDAGTPSVAGADTAAAGLRIEVSLEERRLRVLKDGELLDSYPVAIGKERYPTPTGDFRIGRVVWNPRWVPPKSEWARDATPKEAGEPGNPMGKVKLFFKDPDYYIHGTEAEESLGRAESHGCVRMANADVVGLAQLVMEHGGEQRPPSWYQRVINFVRSTQEVRLSNPVPMTVSG